MAQFNVDWKTRSTELPARITGVWFPLNPVCYGLEEQITWQISHSSGFQQTVIWEVFPWFPEWGVEAWLWNIIKLLALTSQSGFFNLRLDTLSLFIFMALLFLIRHLKGLKIKLFLVSQTLFNHHKYVSKTLTDSLATIVCFYLLFD